MACRQGRMTDISTRPCCCRLTPPPSMIPLIRHTLPRTLLLAHPRTRLAPQSHQSFFSPDAKTSFIKRFLFGGPSASPEDIMAAKQKAQKIIDENPVAVFSKSYCPYCRASKSALSEAGAKPYILELDQIDDGSEIQAALEELTNQRTVPNIFIGKKHIGGNSQLQAISRSLPQLLKDAHAI